MIKSFFNANNVGEINAIYDKRIPECHCRK